MFKFTDTIQMSEDGAWVHLKDRGRFAYLDDDKSKPIRIKVRGPDSPTLQAALRKVNAQKMKESAGTDMAKMSVGEIEDLLERGKGNIPNTWRLATITWENMPDGKGGAMPYSDDAARDLYDNNPAIVRQLSQDAGGIDDFLELADAS
ncbi:hypothetical protein [Tateyamaria sp.]|uniref:hypothetical protein n=1 Tax=Tateyamaria sp. TaxID=1929288 RepID=UPI003B21E702